MQENALMHVQTRLPATLQDVDNYCVKMCRQLADNLIASDLFAAELLLREALNNSVMYGSGVNSALTVECEILLSKSMLTIHCKDPGNGFDWRTKLTSNADIDAVSGRGHAIFRSYASSVSYNDKGNELTLVRKLAREANHVQ